MMYLIKKHNFGAWLAGLIDADGHITKSGYISISFHSHDDSVALYVQHIVGYGYIYYYKKVNACRYDCTDKVGVKIIAKLIANQLKFLEKIKAYNLYFAPRFKILPSICSNIDNSAWLAGFIQGDGSFQIKIRNPHARFKKHPVEVVVQIELKHEYLLKQIQMLYGGHLGFRKPRNTYTYSSVNLTNAQKFSVYFKMQLCTCAKRTTKYLFCGIQY